MTEKLVGRQDEMGNKYEIPENLVTSFDAQCDTACAIVADCDKMSAWADIRSRWGGFIVNR